MRKNTRRFIALGLILGSLCGTMIQGVEATATNKDSKVITAKKDASLFDVLSNDLSVIKRFSTSEQNGKSMVNDNKNLFKEDIVDKITSTNRNVLVTKQYFGELVEKQSKFEEYFNKGNVLILFDNDDEKLLEISEQLGLPVEISTESKRKPEESMFVSKQVDQLQEVNITELKTIARLVFKNQEEYVVHELSVPEYWNKEKSLDKLDTFLKENIESNRASIPGGWGPSEPDTTTTDGEWKSAIKYNNTYTNDDKGDLLVSYRIQVLLGEDGYDYYGVKTEIDAKPGDHVYDSKWDSQQVTFKASGFNYNTGDINIEECLPDSTQGYVTKGFTVGFDCEISKKPKATGGFSWSWSHTADDIQITKDKISQSKVEWTYDINDRTKTADKPMTFRPGVIFNCDSELRWMGIQFNVTYTVDSWNTSPKEAIDESVTIKIVGEEGKES